MNLTTPLTDEVIKRLKAGDVVSLTGEIYTARDSTHKKLLKYLSEGNKLPFELQGAIIYYCGPTPPPPGKIIGSCGPTTSMRMDIYTLPLLEKGLKGMIGKGKRSKEVIEGIKKFRAVYFLAVGGAGAYLSQFVKESKVLLFPELGTEALTCLVVEKFPILVAIDSKGNTLTPWF
ncbi:fumarate hydratase C-terminal domain-containing protein [Candidatus Calescamantes bacterium]|nr:fumarate hydratase C-terminal domain-containing protein [Candidatus Calescamantes bacterium]